MNLTIHLQSKDAKRFISYLEKGGIAKAFRLAPEECTEQTVVIKRRC